MFKSVIRHGFNKVKHAFHRPFYMRPQKFAVDYRISVRNELDVPNPVSVVAPLPLDTFRQKLVSELSFSPEKPYIQTDSEYGNRYAVWHDTLKPREEKIFAITYTVATLPLHIDFHNIHSSLNHYRTFTPDEKKFLKSNKYIQVDERVKSLALKICGTNSGIYENLDLINEFVIANLKYGNPITGLYSSSEALEKRFVDCGGFSTLTGALAIARGIPSRIVSGFWLGYKKNTMHAWVECLTPESFWTPLDADIEQLRRAHRSEKMGGIGIIGSDRLELSRGCDIPIMIDKNEIRVDILQHPFIHSESGPSSFHQHLYFDSHFSS